MADDYAKQLALSIARGVPQLASGFVDLAALPFTATGLMQPQDAIGSTDWMTARGWLPPKQPGVVNETAELVSGAINPAAAMKMGALGVVGSAGKALKSDGKALGQALARQKTEFEIAHELAQQRAALPIEQGGLGLHPNNTPMERAAAMGFDTPAYHATNANISAFDTSKFGANDYGAIGRGVYVDPSKDASYSSNFLTFLPAQEGGNVMPLMVNKGNAFDAAELPFINSEARSQAVTNSLKDMGYDSTVSTINGSPNEIAIFNPANIRSRFAAFDPFNRNSGNILAGIGAGAVGLGLFNPYAEQQ